jgi:hypothetical protein
MNQVIASHGQHSSSNAPRPDRVFVVGGLPAPATPFASSGRAALLRGDCSIHRVRRESSAAVWPEPVEVGGRRGRRLAMARISSSRSQPLHSSTGAVARRLGGAALTAVPGCNRQIQPLLRLVRRACFVVRDTASRSAAVMLRLRPRYVSKAAILGLPGHIVPVKKSKSHLNSKGLDR